MASGTIKGITIEIEGKTSGLVKSLGDVNKNLALTQKSLTTVNKALKMDPGNVDALAKKQSILTTAIEQTREKLELEKKAAEDAAKALEDGTITKGQYDALQAEVAKTSAEMNKLEKEAKETDSALNKTSDSKRFDKLKSALETTGKAMKVAAKAAAAITTAATAAAGAITKLASSSAEYADEIDKTSQKIGISKKAYQEWKYVMDRNGMDVNTLQTGMKKLNAQMLKNQQETDKSKTALGKLGISATDSTGKLRDQEDVLYDVIIALASMDEGADRAKLATELLGKSGTELAPLLNSGADSIQSLTKKAHDLGLVMSDEAVEAGVELKDTMDDVKASFKALGNNLGSSLTPVVKKFSDQILKFMPKFQSMFDRIAPSLETFMDAMLPVLVDLGEQVLPPLLDLLTGLLVPLMDIVKAVLPVICELLATLVPPLVEIVQAIMPVLVTLVEALTPILDAVVKILKPVLDLVVSLIKPLLQLIQEILQPLTDLFKGVGDTLETVLGPAIELIGGLLNTLLGPAFEAIGAIVSGVCEVVFGSWEALGDKLRGLWEGLRDFAAGIWQEISKMADAAVEKILGAIDDAETAAAKGRAAGYASAGITQAEAESKVAEYNRKRQARESTRVSTASNGGTTNVYVNGVRVSTVNNATQTASAKRSGGR